MLKPNPQGDDIGGGAFGRWLGQKGVAPRMWLVPQGPSPLLEWIGPEVA